MTSPLGQFLEGALGGVERGYQFRTGIEDRKRRIASEEDAAQYERARRLREDVAFGLQQRVLQGQLDAQARAANAPPRLEEVSPGATLFDPVNRTPVYTAPERTATPREQGLMSVAPGSTIFNPSTGRPLYTAPERPAGSGAKFNANIEKLKTGAEGAIQALDQIDALLKQDPNADVYPVASRIAEGASHLPFGLGTALSGITEPLAQSQRTPNQQRFEVLVNSLTHNAVGLLPGSRQSQKLFESLKETFRPKAGSSQPARAESALLRSQLRARLRAILAAANGDPSFDPESLTENDLLSGANIVSDAPPPLLRRNTDQPPPPQKKRADPSRFYRP